MPLLEQTKNNAAAFHVVNLGCKVNRVESDDFAAVLIADGGREVPIEAADFIVVNTCTVTGEAEKKTRKAVRQALRANDFARVVVTGCAAAIDPITYTEMDPRVEVVPKGAMADVLGSHVARLGRHSCGRGISHARWREGARWLQQCVHVLHRAGRAWACHIATLRGDYCGSA